MSSKSLAKAIWWLMMYSLRGTGMEEAIDEAAMTLQHTMRKYFDKVNAYWDSKCSFTVRSDGYDCVQWHKNKDIMSF